MRFERVFFIVLDSLGIGELPDAAEYGDTGSNTLKTISGMPGFAIPNLIKLGIGMIDGVDYLPKTEKPLAAYGRLAEASKGKDTTTGHFEIAGLISTKPFPTYPGGFPPEIVAEFERKTGIGTLCNKPYSGTKVIEDYGAEHIKTGKIILYTSADSVFQLAAHERYFGLERLYECCKIAREIMRGPHGVARIIARPFEGEPGSFKRTERRHDFAIEPDGRTMLDCVSGAGLDMISVGKIKDIFAGRGITGSIHTGNNAEGMQAIEEIAGRPFKGLCFINLVDFDMLYGHRNDAPGYAAALMRFDVFLGRFLKKLGEKDCLIITADHGCDPGTPSTDHSREYIPALFYGKTIKPINYGTRKTFADIGKTVLNFLGVENNISGEEIKL